MCKAITTIADQRPHVGLKTEFWPIWPIWPQPGLPGCSQVFPGFFTFSSQVFPDLRAWPFVFLENLR